MFWLFSQKLVADRMQEDKLSVFGLVEGCQVDSFLLVQDGVNVSVGDMISAVFLTIVVGCLFFVQPFLSFFDALPGQRVNSFHPSFDLLVIAKFNVVFN